MPAAANTASIDTAIDNLVAVIAAKTAEWVASGSPPSFSVDGESYSWDQWLKTKNDEIAGLIKTKRLLSGPFISRTYGRP
jgi:hypothetical protein